MSATDNSELGGIVGLYFSDEFSKNVFFNQSKNPNLPAVGKYKAGVKRSKIINVTGRTAAEMKQKAAFKDWNFDKIWRIDEGKDTPRLRGLAEKNTAPAPTPTPPTAGTTPAPTPPTGTTPPASGSNPKPPTAGTTPAPTPAPAPTPTPPSSGTTPPSSGTTPPSSGTTPPSSGTTPPSSGTTPPSSGTTPKPPSTTPTPPASGSNPKPPIASTPTPAPKPKPPSSGIVPNISLDSGKQKAKDWLKKAQDFFEKAKREHQIKDTSAIKQKYGTIIHPTVSSKDSKLSEDEFYKVSGIFYKIENDSNKVNDWVGFMEAGFSPEAYIDYGMSKLQDALKSVDNIIMKRTISKIENPNHSLLFNIRHEHEIENKGVNSKIAKSWGLTYDDVELLKKANYKSSTYNLSDLYSINNNMILDGSNSKSVASQAVVSAFLMNSQNTDYINLENSEQAIQTLDVYKNIIKTYDVSSKVQKASLDLFDIYRSGDKKSLSKIAKIVKSTDDIYNAFKSLIKEDKPKTLSRYTVGKTLDGVLGLAGYSEYIPDTLKDKVLDAVMGGDNNKEVDAATLVKNLAELNEGVRLSLLLANHREQQRVYAEFFKKASRQDKLKLIAQQAILNHSSNRGVNLKGKEVFVIKENKGWFKDSYTLERKIVR